VRTKIISYLKEWTELDGHEEFEFLWITDFPLFSPSRGWAAHRAHRRFAELKSTHHPFTAPRVRDIKELVPCEDPMSVLGQHYDLVVNGVELGGGSVRIHDADLQYYILKNILKVVSLKPLI
jgi:aspartyl-tRNA synthetase